jgi:hypothetical protein
VVQAYWSVPEADQYNVAEIKSGQQFLYSTTGGAVFQAYGSQFRLVLVNSGEQSIRLQNVIVFRRSQ